MDQFPLQSPRALGMGWAPSRKGSISVLVHVLKDILPAADVPDEKVTLLQPPSRRWSTLLLFMGDPPWKVLAEPGSCYEPQKTCADFSSTPDHKRLCV